MAAAKFHVYADSGDKWRWKLVSSNGQTIASSGESFSSRSSAQEAAKNVKERAALAQKSWLTTDARGRCRAPRRRRGSARAGSKRRGRERQRRRHRLSPPQRP